mgnify:CR=1 FL=1
MNAYISYICNDNYLPGVVALIKSLKYHKCSFNIIIMVTYNVSLKSKEILLKLGVIIKIVEEIHYQGKLKHLIEDRYGKQNNSWMMFTKINIWKEINYKKLLYIDADTIVLKNIDHIFKINHNLSAVLGGSTFHNYKGIEAGILLLKPSIDTYNNLIKAMNSDKYDLRMSDQTLINDYFLKHDKINYLEEKWNRLQKKNNSILGAFIYHWNGQKPWINRVINDNIWNFYYNL